MNENFEKQYNLNSPSVKRIMREMKEMAKDKSSQYNALPLDDNIFEWHFTVRGPKDTEFETGIYHGRIILPSDYPFKPPHIVILTPNGRFEIGKKICLSMSAYHEENWQPSWSVRTVLLAIISFLPAKGEIANGIGAIDAPATERRRLAGKSLSWSCSKCGSHNLTALPEPTETNSQISDEDLADLPVISSIKELNESTENVSNKEQEPKQELKREVKPEPEPEPTIVEDIPDERCEPEPTVETRNLYIPVNIPQNNQKSQPVKNLEETKLLNMFIVGLIILLIAVLLIKFM